MRIPSDIRREDKNTFYVKSSSDPKKEYMVYLDDDGSWGCECHDYWVHLPERGQIMTHKCKHILRCVLLYISV
jgi:hypothetical protein